MSNPYSSPEADCRPQPAKAVDSSTLVHIRKSLRRLIYWLAPAAILNLMWFQWTFNTPVSWGDGERWVFAAILTFPVCLVGIGITWLLGPSCTMFVARQLYRLFGAETTLQQWMAVLADSMTTLQRLAPGFTVGWLIAVVELNLNHVAILGPCVCHVLAAIWYFPLFRAWFALRSLPE